MRGEQLTLTNKEYELLLFLARHPNWVFSREDLYELIWGLESMGDNITVAVHVNRLREKVEENPSKPQRIQTVWGCWLPFKYALRLRYPIFNLSLHTGLARLRGQIFSTEVNVMKNYVMTKNYKKAFRRLIICFVILAVISAVGIPLSLSQQIHDASVLAFWIVRDQPARA